MAPLAGMPAGVRTLQTWVMSRQFMPQQEPTAAYALYETAELSGCSGCSFPLVSWQRLHSISSCSPLKELCLTATDVAKVAVYWRITSVQTLVAQPYCCSFRAWHVSDKLKTWASLLDCSSCRSPVSSAARSSSSNTGHTQAVTALTCIGAMR